MGKKRVSVIGDIDFEEQARNKRTIQREQKAIRKGKKIKAEEQTISEPDIKRTSDEKIKSAKVAGMKGGERVVDTTSESLEELERLKQKQQTVDQLSTPTSATPAKPKRIRSKRYQQAKYQLIDGKSYPIHEALNLLRKLNLTKFPASIEIHLNLIKQDAFTNQILDLPHGIGKTKKVAIVNQSLIDQLSQGQIDFDILLATKSDMPQLIKYAKLLGPKGLMPNPKAGTIVDDPKKSISKFTTANRLELKIEKKAPLIHAVIGKLNMENTQLEENLFTIIQTVGTKNIRKAFLTTSMSPSIKLD